MPINSVSRAAFDPRVVAGVARGAIEAFDYVDGYPGLVPHPRVRQVPRGAPLVVRGAVAAGRGPDGFRVVLDAAYAFDAEHAQCSFRSVVDTSELLPGAHEVRAYAVEANAWYEFAHVAFRVHDPAPADPPEASPYGSVRVDAVLAVNASGELTRRTLPVPCGEFALVSGWATDASHRAAPHAVAACDAHGRMWTAPCDVPRPDIRAARGAGDAMGFEIVIPADALGRGRHLLRVAPYDGRDVAVAGDQHVTIDVAAEQRAFPSFARSLPAPATCRIERASIDGAGVRLEGWALTTSGAGASEVFVELRVPELSVPIHRIPALAGFTADVVSADGPASPPGAAFACEFDASGFVRRTYAVHVAVVEPGRGACAFARCGTLTVDAHGPRWRA